MIKADIQVPDLKTNPQALNKALWQSVTLVRSKAAEKAPYKTGALR
jgi:hypothetical protein